MIVCNKSMKPKDIGWDSIGKAKEINKESKIINFIQRIV